VAEEAGRAEEGVDPFAVGGAAGRGVAVPVVGLAGVVLAGGDALPEDLAVAGAEAQDVALLAFVRGGGRKYGVAPDDRRGVAAAGQRRLPEHVLPFAPGQRDAVVAAVALTAGAAPVGPVVRQDRGARGDVRGRGRGVQNAQADKAASQEESQK